MATSCRHAPRSSPTLLRRRWVVVRCSFALGELCLNNSHEMYPAAHICLQLLQPFSATLTGARLGVCGITLCCAGGLAATDVDAPCHWAQPGELTMLPDLRALPKMNTIQEPQCCLWSCTGAAAVPGETGTAHQRPRVGAPAACVWRHAGWPAPPAAPAAGCVLPLDCGPWPISLAQLTSDAPNPLRIPAFCHAATGT